MEFELIQKVVSDLQAKLVGARIAKIHQPEAEMMVLRLWNGRENLRLLLSSAAQGSRIHLTEKSFPNPFTPPRFCQLLRARITRVVGIEIVNDDRIVKIDCQGPKGETALYLELTGRSSNMLLLDGAGKIIDCLKRHDGVGERRLIPGENYCLPQKAGFVKGEGKEVSHPPTTNSELHRFVEKLYTDDIAAENIKDLPSRMHRIIVAQLKKLQKRLKKIEEERARQQGYEKYRQIGDLLLANLHHLKRGMSEVELVDYYRQPPEDVVVLLNSKLSPQENAEKYYQKSKKAKRGLEHSERRINETINEIEWLQQLEYQLGLSVDTDEIIYIADELKKAGLLKEKINRLPRRSNASRTKFKEIISPADSRILWGISSQQNDLLTTREMKKTDLWFHAYRVPGSHVVLRAAEGRHDFTEEDILLAASIAAANSKARNDHKVEVMQAEAKHVRKPAGVKSGMVAVKKYKTLIVEPHRKEE